MEKRDRMMNIETKSRDRTDRWTADDDDSSMVDRLWSYVP